MKYIISFILPLLALLVSSCSSEDDIQIAEENMIESVGFTPVGDPIQVTLNLTVLPYEDDDASTRAEELSDDQTADVTSSIETGALEMEKYMYTFWIFEYDATDSTLVNAPYYYKPSQYENTGEHKFEDITLSSNHGKPVILYAIVNADGSSTTTVQNWVKLDESTGEYTGFMSIKELEAQALPTSYSYDSSHTFTTNKWPPFFSSSSGAGWTRFIPKSGWTEPIILSNVTEVEIPVTNMYAKIIPYVQKETSSTIQGNFVVENVPLYCRVGALADKETTKAFDYTKIEGLQWTYFSISSLSSWGQYGSQSETGNAVRAWYLPENIQGEVSDYEEGATRESLVPSSQYEGTTKDCDIPATPTATSQVKWDENWSCASTTDAMAVHFYYNKSSENKCCTIYPGGNNLNNFNVRRNCTYRVKYILKGE